MKRFLAGLLAGIILATGFSAMADSPAIRLFVNGKEVVSDVPAQIINGRTLVPARPLAEALGAKVEWDQEGWAVNVASAAASTVEPPLTADPVLSRYPEIISVLMAKYPGQRVDVSGSQLRLGDKLYSMPIIRTDRGRFAEVSTLLDAGVITTADIAQ